MAWQELVRNYRQTINAELMQRAGASIPLMSLPRWGGPEAETVALEGLRQWLSWDELRDFDNHGHFFVTGGLSGRRYRIRKNDANYNVDEIGDDGRPIAKLCFGPVSSSVWDFGGTFPKGDVLLDQKFGLVHDECETLRIANRARIIRAKDGDVIRAQCGASFIFDDDVPPGTRVTVVFPPSPDGSPDHVLFTKNTDGDWSHSRPTQAEMNRAPAAGIDFHKLEDGPEPVTAGTVDIR